MITVKNNTETHEFKTLDLAMAWAKISGDFVIIDIDGMQLVGRFGVDAVKDGLCPDGIAYDWNKASRIGRVKRSRS